MILASVSIAFVAGYLALPVLAVLVMLNRIITRSKEAQPPSER